MKFQPPTNERGFSLVEALVATLVTVVVAGVAMGLLASTKRASDVGQPMVERAGTRAAALAEIMSTIRDSAARSAYFDLERTVGSITFDGGDGGGGGGGGGGQSGPPPGYCLVKKNDPATWPPGFDPHDPGTWDDVAWWDGADREEPSTWYYDCEASGGGDGKKDRRAAVATSASETVPPSSIPHQFTLTPVASYGTGIEIGTTERRFRIVGPVASLEESANLAGGQVGAALVVLRTEPLPGTLRLGASLVTSGSVIRLVARDELDRRSTMGLVPGDLLYVTGKDSSDVVRTSLVALRTAPREVAGPTPTLAGGAPLFQYYEAEIEAPDATYAGYLRNTKDTASGAELQADAAVALVARDGAIVSYFVVKGADGYGLVRVAGNPFEPNVVEQLVANVDKGLQIETEPWTTDDLATTPKAATLVRIALPVLVDATGHEAEPLEAEIALLNAASRRKPVTMTWDAIVTPEGGALGGAK